MIYTIKVEAYGEDFNTALDYAKRALNDTSDTCSMFNGGYALTVETIDGLQATPKRELWSKMRGCEDE